MVIDVSAIFVARITLRVSGGAGAKTRCCCAVGRAAKIGQGRSFAAVEGRAAVCSRRSFSSVSISS